MSILALLFLSIILSGIQLGNNEKEVPKTIDTGAALILRRTASISLTALYTFMFVVLSIVWYDSTSPTLPLSTICIMLFELVVSALGVFFAIKNCERQRSRTAIIFQVVLIPLMLMFLIPMLIGFTALSLGTASISIAVTLIVLAITSLVLTILSLTFKVKNKLDEKLAAYTQLLTDGAITETEYQKLVAKCTRTAFSQTAETEASEDKNEK
jgi:membrane-associated HD superfamily phosphohydrolase